MTAELHPQAGEHRQDGDSLRKLRVVPEGERSRRQTFYERILKRPLDVVAASALLLVLAPVLLGVALAIRIRMGSRVLYRQTRVGRYGQPFTILKFRTMKHDRRQRAPETLIEDFSGPDRRLTHKTTDDPRHTNLGSTLRKYALDELPQLINVLRGEMSMVGPRPEILEVAECHDIVGHCRHLVHPGITGPWQLSDSRSEFIHDNLAFDEEYVAKVTFKNDIVYMLRTVKLFKAPTGS